MSSSNGLYVFDATYFVKSPCHEKVIKVFSKVCSKYIFQLEQCPTTKSLHYQCYIKFSSRLRPKQCGAMLSGLGLEGISTRPCSTGGKALLQTYVMKDETRIAGPWADKPVWKLTYAAKDLKCMSDPLPLQSYILNLLKAPVDDRCIFWFFDPIGCNGKSKLCKYLEWTDQACEIPFGTATQIKTSIIAEGRHKCYLLDVPRTTGKDESLQDSFSTIEAIKKGFVKSAMYGKVQKLWMEPPHVFVFSNSLPCKHLVSLDRWKVYEVCENKNIVRKKDWTCAKCAKKRIVRKSS